MLLSPTCGTRSRCDDVPDGAPEVLLDGFVPPAENYHNYANGLRFGPDGWLYGRCGASSAGEIGAPGTPAHERIPMRGAIWRYHPRTKVFEALSCGTTNPWGHDWNEYGELFFINTVNGHLWHGFAGAHYMRPHTIDPNPRVYKQIDQHADHWHFDTAEGWGRSRDGRADSYGGGHAHVGMMIYLGDNWPAEYRGRLFTINMHGRRANQEILERRGSGYVGRHGADFFFAADPWFRGIELSYGPDGSVFVLDWADTGECHESTGVHRTSGRIYKITCGQPKSGTTTDLAKLSVDELVNLHTHANEWFVRQARLELVSRLATGGFSLSAVKELRSLFAKSSDTVVKLRALWSLYSIDHADAQFLSEQLLDVRFLNPIAARGLAMFDDPAVGARLVKAYRQFHPSERPQLLAALVSRPAFAAALLDAIGEAKIPRADLSAFGARQIRGLNDEVLNKKLVEVWGDFREAHTDKQQVIGQWKSRLTPALLAKADKGGGWLVFGRACASCHRLYGEGATPGPDLTGAGRGNLDYLLENIVDPSAVMSADLRMSVVTLKDGRVLNGLVTSQTERTISLRTATETMTLERAEITSIGQESKLSLMPDGLLDALSHEEVRNLIAYLMHQSQVPLPTSKR